PFSCDRAFSPIHAAGHRSVDGAEYIQQTLETAAADREPFSASQGHFGVAADEWQNFGDGSDTDNMLAGNSNECGRVEPLLQFGQRHIHPAALAATVERRHAFVNREIVGLFCRNYAEASALLGKEAGLRPRLGANEVVHRLVARGSDGLSHAVQSLGEPDAVHRFQQVVHGVHLKRIHGVFVERGAEYDFGTRQAQGGGDVEPAAPGHLNVEKDQVRLQRRNQFDRLFAFLRFANNLEVGVRGQQLAKVIARRLLVIHQQDADHGRTSPPVAVRCAGNSSATTVIDPSRPILSAPRSPKYRCRRSSMLRKPKPCPPARGARAPGVNPLPLSRTSRKSLSPRHSPRIFTIPTPRTEQTPCLIAFSTSTCITMAGTRSCCAASSTASSIFKPGPKSD